VNIEYYNAQIDEIQEQNKAIALRLFGVIHIEVLRTSTGVITFSVAVRNGYSQRRKVGGQ
jgi:hypothetical protein